MAKKLKVKISRIECVRKSAELDKFDEIYCILRLFSASVKDGKVALGEVAKVQGSDIRREVRRDTVWEPSPQTFTFDLGSNQAFGLYFSLAEGDNKKLYNAVHSGSLQAEFANYNWGELAGELLDSVPQDPQNPMSWVSVILKALANIFKGLRQDDVMGTEIFGYQVNDERLATAKTFEFRRGFAHYRGVLELSIEGEGAPATNSDVVA